MKFSSHFATFAVCAAGISVLMTACGAPSSNQATTNTTTANNATSTQSNEFPVTLTDDVGKKVTVSALPQHIVSGTEGTDEILSALVGKSRISLVTNLATDPTYSNVVTQVKGIPQIADIDPEKILSAHPDLVLLASYVKPGVVEQVRNAGIPVYEFDDFTSLDSIEKNIQVVGKLVGNSEKATKVVNNLNQNIQKIKSAVAGKPSVSVLDYSSYGFAGGSETTVNDMIRAAGGTNAAATLKGWQKVTDEEIVKMNPDVIVDSVADKAFLNKLAKEPALQSVSAIKNHRLYAVSDADLSSVSQYIVKGMVDVAKDIHPDAVIPDIQVMQ